MLVHWFVPCFLFLFDSTLQSWGLAVAVGPLRGCSLVCCSSTLQVVGLVVTVCKFWGWALVIPRWRVSFCAIVSFLFLFSYLVFCTLQAIFFNGRSRCLEILLQNIFPCGLIFFSSKPCIFICWLPHPAYCAIAILKIAMQRGLENEFGVATRGNHSSGCSGRECFYSLGQKICPPVSFALSFLFYMTSSASEKLVGCTPWIGSNRSLCSTNL